MDSITQAILDDLSSNGDTISVQFSLPSLGGADDVEESFDDGKKHRGWRAVVFEEDTLKVLLDERERPDLLELPISTTFLLRKGEICPHTNARHHEYVFNFTHAKSFNEVRNIFKKLHFKNPRLNWFNISDLKTLTRHLNYAAKQHTTATDWTGTIFQSGGIKGSSPLQWLHAQNTASENRAAKKVKLSTKEEAQIFLQNYIANELAPHENLNDLYAQAYNKRDESQLMMHLSLNPAVAKNLLQGRDAALRMIRRQRTGLTILQGGAGTQKSTDAASEGRPLDIPINNFIHVHEYGEGFTDYTNQTRVVCEEFNGSRMEYETLKQMTDDNPNAAPFQRKVKNRAPVQYNHEEVWFTSNRVFTSWYPGVWSKHNHEWLAFTRRINIVRHCPQWRISDLTDPTSVILKDGKPVRNQYVEGGLAVQKIDLTQSYKSCNNHRDACALSLFWEDQMPGHKHYGLCEFERSAILNILPPIDFGDQPTPWAIRQTRTDRPL